MREWRELGPDHLLRRLSVQLHRGVPRPPARSRDIHYHLPHRYIHHSPRIKIVQCLSSQIRAEHVFICVKYKRADIQTWNFIQTRDTTDRPIAIACWENVILLISSCFYRLYAVIPRALRVSHHLSFLQVNEQHVKLKFDKLIKTGVWCHFVKTHNFNYFNFEY